MTILRKISTIFLFAVIVLSPYSLSYAARSSESVMTAGIYVDAEKYGDMFVAANRWGVELFEVNNQGQISSISKIKTSGRAEFLDTKDDLVAVSNLDGSIEFFRIVDGRLRIAGYLDLDFHPLELKIVEGYLYVGGVERPLVVYDISDPAHATMTSEIPFIGYPHDFKVRNDSMFVAAYHGGVVILDISVRSHPVKLEQYFMPDFVYGIEIDSSYVYVCAHQAGLYVLDLRFNSRPPVIGYDPNYGSARKAAVVDAGLLVLDGFGGLKLIDLTSRSRPEQIWRLPLEFNCYDMEISGDLVFLANWIEGAKTIRLDGKEGAEVISAIRNYAICKSIAVDRGRILAAAGDGGLLVYDSDLKPVTTHDLEINKDCTEIRVQDDKGFLSNDENGFMILELKDDGDIDKISNLETQGWVQSSVFNGQYAFLANWQGIVSVDLSNINEPLQDGFFDTYFGSAKIEFRNDTVFVAGSGGLEVYDASDPRDVRFLDRYYTEHPSQNLKFYSDMVILSSGMDGVNCIRLDGRLDLVSNIPTGGNARDTEIRGDRLFVAEEDSGVTVWDISSMESPEFLLRYHTTGKAYDIALDGNRIYVADYYGISMLELVWEDVYQGDDSQRDPEPRRTLSVYPNPVVGKMSIQLDTGVSGMIDVELYDILGRRVKTLYRGYSTGSAAINWRKNDLPSGYYFVRVTGEGFSETRKVTLVR